MCLPVSLSAFTLLRFAGPPGGVCGLFLSFGIFLALISSAAFLCLFFCLSFWDSHGALSVARPEGISERNPRVTTPETDSQGAARPYERLTTFWCFHGSSTLGRSPPSVSCWLGRLHGHLGTREDRTGSGSSVPTERPPRLGKFSGRCQRLLQLRSVAGALTGSSRGSASVSTAREGKQVP